MKQVMLFLFILLSNIGYNQVSTFLDVTYHSVDSIDQNLLSFDAYVPAVEGPKPIILYVHGGGWVSGDKSIFGEKMKLFTDLGYIFISINYRLSPIPYQLDNSNRIKYPQHPDDVARAIAFILDQAEDNEGDLEKVAIIGHSAGAQIVSLIMTDESFLEAYGHSPADLKCLCSLDTGGYDINLWLGSASEATIDLYTNAFSADSLIRRQASPAINVDDMDELPSTLLIHQSTLKREYINTLFADSLRNYGAEVKTISTDYSHGEINQKIGDFSTDTSALYTQEIVDWFEACLFTTVATSEAAPLNIQFFPNPVSDLLYFSEYGIYKFQNLQGKLMFEGQGNQIDVSGLKSGLYLLNLEVQGRKIVKMIFVE